MEKNILRNLIKKILKETVSSSELESTQSTFDDTPDSSKENIKCIQRAMISAGLGNLLGTTGPNGDGVDGKYGDKTMKAVKKYQENNGISNPGTGWVGPKTAESIGCRRLMTSKDKQKQKPVVTNPKVPEPPKTEGKVTCPSLFTSPNFREKNTIVKYWQWRFPNLKTDSEVMAFIDRMIQRDAGIYRTYINNSRVSCEVASIGMRPWATKKNAIIVDSPSKRIFIFGVAKEGFTRSLVAQDIIIDGKNKQRNDALNIAKAFVTFEQRYKQMKQKNGGKAPSDKEVWDSFDKEGSRFLPAGVYKPGKTSNLGDYATDAAGDNVFSLKSWNGQDISQAVHGYYKGDERVKSMQQALKIVKDPNNTDQIDKFQKTLASGGLNLDWSFGCINVPPRFLKYLRQYMSNSFVYNIAEDTESYLVQNSENFFDKQMNSQECLSPQQLGAQQISDIA